MVRLPAKPFAAFGLAGFDRHTLDGLVQVKAGS